MSNEFSNSVKTEHSGGWQKLISFMGPAYMVSVGYMDPGNWATDIAAGSKYGYALIWVIILSNIIAILVQSHSARLGIVTGKDIAQFSRAYYPKSLNFVFWLLAEIAIAATDLAEILGMAIGLKLLFGLNMLAGVTLTLFDTFIIMYLIKKGIRQWEAIIIGLISVIGISFVIELFFSKPDLSELIKGIIPSLPDSGALYIAIGIIGATVMPHNIYLHSSMVQTRQFSKDTAGRSSAIKYNFIDTIIALNFALFVNSAILILAASTFYKSGHFDVQDIMDAHKMLAPLLGTELAPVLFAVALIASGQSSTLTGTLTGQIIMEGYLNLRITPWLRRLITRLLAVIPAFITIVVAGEKMVGNLLILSQVILSLQLGFVVVPLIHWVSSSKIMGEFAIKLPARIVSWLSILLIIGLNLKMVVELTADWISCSSDPLLIYILVIPLMVAVFILLIYSIVEPFFRKDIVAEIVSPHPAAENFILNTPKPFNKIGIGVDFTSGDISSINYAIKFGIEKTEIMLIHVVESTTARMMTTEVFDNETVVDTSALNKYAQQLKRLDVNATIYIGFGQVEHALPQIVKEQGIELLLMSSHKKGFLHRFFKGTTINKIQQKVDIPVFIAK